jgi:hypothetical protein
LNKVLSVENRYASIDSACDSVKRKLRKYKERIIDAHRAGRPEAADFDAGEIEVFFIFCFTRVIEVFILFYEPQAADFDDGAPSSKSAACGS